MSESNDLKVNLHQLLKTMIEKVRATCTSPPVRRAAAYRREHRAAEAAGAGAGGDEGAVLHGPHEEQRAHFEKHNELDLSFGVKGSPASAQHLHAARERGRRVPHIPFKILSFDELACPRSCPTSR